MPSSTEYESASKLLSQTNELLKKLARLKSNVELYKQVRLLQENFNALEENYNSLQDNIKTSTCNTQCNGLNATSESSSVEGFLALLLLSKYKSYSFFKRHFSRFIIKSEFGWNALWY